MDGPIVVRKHTSFARQSRRRGILVATTISLSDDGTQSTSSRAHSHAPASSPHTVFSSRRATDPQLVSSVIKEDTATPARTGGPESDVAYGDEDEGVASTRTKANAASAAVTPSTTSVSSRGGVREDYVGGDSALHTRSSLRRPVRSRLMQSRPREQRGEPRAPMVVGPVMPSDRRWRPKVRVRARRRLCARRVPGKVRGCATSLRARASKADERSVSSTALRRTRGARRWWRWIRAARRGSEWLCRPTTPARTTVLLSEPSISITRRCDPESGQKREFP